MSTAPVTVIENVQLEEIEKAIYSRNYETASRLLLVGLRKLKQGAQFIGYAPTAPIQSLLYTRLCSAIITLLSDPAFGISHEGFAHFASEHAITDVLFRASIFGTSDHMLPVLASNPNEADKSKLQVSDGAGLVKFLLTYSLRSGFGLNYGETFRRSPAVMAPLWAGMISPLLTVAKQAHDRREELLGLHGIFEGATLPDAVLPTLSDAYMYSSYGTRADKHDMKGTVHRLFAQVLRDRGVKVPEPAVMTRRRQRTLDPIEKPRLLIACEWWGSLHAMFRCYAPIIRQLRGHYHLIGMSRERDTDAEAKLEFDEWHEVPADNLQLNDLVRKIVSDLRPDMIYYPSLGMAMWWVILASVRLAPIQFMTLGHPASSRSPCIDYVVCEEGAVGNPESFTERIVEIPANSARFVMRSDTVMPEPLPFDATPETVRIAIPSMLCKLNAPFMTALQEIAKGRNVEYHFFVNMIGLNLFQAHREITEWFPNAIVYERTQYPNYLAKLQRCHLHLCTFPFGGTNSNIDSMMLGIPVLALEGAEPHGRFDVMLNRYAGMPNALNATSRDEYVDTAQRLIDNHDWRNSLVEQLRATDLNARFFTAPAHPNAFLNAVNKIYFDHGTLGKVTKV